MRARLLTLLLIMLLALPVTAVLPPVLASPQLQELPAPTLAAKKKNKKPKFKTVTRIVRQTVTQTFASAGGVTIIPLSGRGTPYPSTIDVTGFTNGAITDINLLLTGFSHSNPDDFDILLVPAHVPGQNAIVLSDVGGDPGAVSLNLTLDDQAAAPLPDAGPLVSGTFQPTNAVGNADFFLAPAPAPSGNSLLSIFNGSNPNGAWQLFVMDDVGGTSGSIASWALQIIAEADVPVEKRVKIKSKKKGKGRR